MSNTFFDAEMPRPDGWLWARNVWQNCQHGEWWYETTWYVGKQVKRLVPGRKVMMIVEMAETFLCCCHHDFLARNKNGPYAHTCRHVPPSPRHQRRNRSLARNGQGQWDRPVVAALTTNLLFLRGSQQQQPLSIGHKNDRNGRDRM